MWIKRTVAVTAVTVGGLLSAAVPALANDCGDSSFCAYEHENFGGYLNLKSTAGPGLKVDVADDVVSSGDNESPYTWEGRNRRRFLPDQTVFTWAPGTEAADLGDADNKIDHFDVK